MTNLLHVLMSCLLTHILHFWKLLQCGLCASPEQRSTKIKLKTVPIYGWLTSASLFSIVVQVIPRPSWTPSWAVCLTPLVWKNVSTVFFHIVKVNWTKLFFCYDSNYLSN